MIFIEFYNDIHSKFINIGLPTDPLVEDSTLETTLLVGVALVSKFFTK